MINSIIKKTLVQRTLTTIFYAISLFLILMISIKTNELIGATCMLLTTTLLITDFALHNVKGRKTLSILAFISAILFGIIFVLPSITAFIFPSYEAFLYTYMLIGSLLASLLIFKLYKLKKDDKHPIREFAYFVLPVVTLLTFFFVNLNNNTDLTHSMFMLSISKDTLMVLTSMFLFPLAFVSMVSLLLIKNKRTETMFASHILAVIFAISMLVSIYSSVDVLPYRTSNQIKSIYDLLYIPATMLLTMLLTVLCLDLKACYYDKIKLLIDNYEKVKSLLDKK